MIERIHFISGLPRSGSTLLAGILKQNPEFHAGMSSPLAFIYNHVITAMGAQHPYAVFIDDEQREDIVRGLFEAFYRRCADRVIFDTNRAWCARLPALARLFPESRIIACVREPAWVLDSFERLFRKSPFVASRMFNQQNGSTVYSRVDALSGINGPSGFAWNALRDAFYGEHASRLILVDYEALTREPKRTMERLYGLLGLPGFEHDFDNVTYEDGAEFDAQLGVRGLHEIRRKVEYVERPTILPPDIFHRFPRQGFWKIPEMNPHNVPVLLPFAPVQGFKASRPRMRDN